MKKVLLLCMSMLLGAMLVAGCGSEEKETSSATGGSDKPIVIGLDDSYPPMGFKDENNEIVGFDVDLAKEATKRLNRPVEFKAIDWSSKEAELKSGRVDILWNGLDITEKRKENMLFSDPYMKNRQVIFVPVNSDIKSLDQLKGKVIGTQSGSTAEDFLDNNQDYAAQFAEVKKYGDYIDAFMDLENGRIDAVVTDELIGTYYMQKHADSFKETDIVVGEPTDFGIAFAKDNQALRDEVQKVMNEMKADGTIAKISEKWFGKDITTKYQQAVRDVVALAVKAGVPVPTFSSAIAYFDSYRSERLPANLIQAQRDYFGAHTYERTDREGIFHYSWYTEE